MDGVQKTLSGGDATESLGKARQVNFSGQSMETERDYGVDRQRMG